MPKCLSLGTLERQWKALRAKYPFVSYCLAANVIVLLFLGAFQAGERIGRTIYFLMNG